MNINIILRDKYTYNNNICKCKCKCNCINKCIKCFKCCKCLIKWNKKRNIPQFGFTFGIDVTSQRLYNHKVYKYQFQSLAYQIYKLSKRSLKSMITNIFRSHKGESKYARVDHMILIKII